MESDVTSEDAVMTVSSLSDCEAEHGPTSFVAVKEFEDLDGRILDLLRIINWRRIERTLMVGGPVMAGVGVIFGLCLVSVGVCCGMLYFREALPEVAVLAATVVGYFGLFLVLVACRVLILAQFDPLPAQRHRVMLPLLFHARNDESEWVDGRVESTHELAEVDGGLRIVTENANMIFRKKGGHSVGGTNNATGISQLLTAAPVYARRYDGRGRVYKVPGFRDLVGQELGNAWLYGDFIRKSCTASAATFSTVAVILLPGEGGTRVDIEFAGGVSISEREIQILDDPHTPESPMCHVGTDDPLELLSVRRENRQLTVRARSSKAFQM